MRAVILATGYGDRLHEMHPDLPAVLAPVADRPFVHHVVERLVDLGVRRFDVVLSRQPEAVEKALGDGGPWGSRITYHLARDRDRPLHVVRLLAPDLDGDAVWLVDAHRLPIGLHRIEVPRGADRDPPESAASGAPGPAARDRASPVLLEGPAGGWCGWAVIDPWWLGRIPDDLVFEALPVWLADGSGRAPERRRVPGVLDVRAPDGLMAANQAVLRGAVDGIAPDAWEREPGVWVGRHADVHPSARLEAPVLIGDRVSVGAGAVVGPGAAVGAGCMVEARSTVRDSVLYPGTFVGEDVDVVDALVRRNRLFKALDGTCLDVPDAFLLGGLTPERGIGLRTRITDRLVALVVLGLTAPVWLAAWLWRGLRRGRNALVARPVLRLPAPEDGSARATFSLWAFEHGWGRRPGVVSARERLHRLPALWNVVRGDLALVGLPPRTPAEVAALPEAWRQVYLGSRPGWITLRDVSRHAPESPEDAFATEAYHAAHAGGLLDLRILGRWLF